MLLLLKYLYTLHFMVRQSINRLASLYDHRVARRTRGVVRYEHRIETVRSVQSIVLEVRLMFVDENRSRQPLDIYVVSDDDVASTDRVDTVLRSKLMRWA
jgi:hypothetical protein